MKFYKIFSAIILLTFLGACQSEALIESSQKEPSQPLNKLTVRASLPNDNETRAQIEWGNISHEDGEKFMWNDDDEIHLHNLSRMEEPTTFNIENINGKNADFYATKEFNVFKGDTIVAIYGQTSRKYSPEATTDNLIFDSQKIITIYNGTEAGKPQMIVSNPNDESLSFLQDNIFMYSVVVVKENNIIPELSFNHLSAIMRVTLHNETGDEIYPTKIEFKYPNTDTFFNTTFYFSVISDENGSFKLKTYDSKDFYKDNAPYTDNIGTTINGKEGTADIGESIKDGESYELYLSTVPRIDNDRTGDNFSIHLIENHKTETPYTITIDNFNKVIEAGKRY